MADDTKTTNPKKRKTEAERLEELRQKEAQLKAKIAAMEAKQKAVDRKQDARRKIIVGGAVLAHAAIDSAFAAELRAILKKAVTRDSDRDTIRDFLD